MIVPVLVRERAGAEPPRGEPASRLLADLGQAFSLRSALVAALLVLGVNFANGVLSAGGYALFIGALKWDSTSYTALTGGWGLVVGGAAAAVTGTLVDRFGRRPMVAVGCIGLAIGWFGFALLRGHWDSRELVWASGLYSAAMTGVLSVATIALCMDLSWERVGGSQFAAYMALSNFSTVLGQQFLVRAMGWWEWHGIYMLAAACQLALLPLLLLIDPTELRRKLPLARVNQTGIAAVIVLLVFLIAMTIRASLKYL